MRLRSIYWEVLARLWILGFCLRWLYRPKAMPEYARHLRRYIKDMRAFPSLGKPRGFNDFVKSSMVFNSDPRKALYADKLIAKEIAKLRCSDIRAPRTLKIYENAKDITFSDLPERFVVKMNNDCGSTIFIDTRECNVQKVRDFLSPRFENAYGLSAGEWHYQHIRPRAFAEELLPLKNGVSPGDFKFHCRNGRVAWCQHIFDRQSQPKEANFHVDGRRIPDKFDPKFENAAEVILPTRYFDMVNVAALLCEDFDYVRIDLYLIGEDIYFGEYTFTPCAGVYPLSIQAVFGKLLDQ